MDLRCALINVENLFLFLDELPQQDLDSMSESAWQGLSTSTIRNKSLAKCQELAAAFLDINADVFLLVEVGGKESLKHFNSIFLKDAYEVYLIEGNSDRAIDVGFLVKRGLPGQWTLKSNKERRLNFLYAHEKLSLEAGYKDMVRGSGTKFSRDVAELQLRLGKKIELIFLLTHLKSKREGFQYDPQGGDKRRAEVKGLVDIYLERKKLLGDEVPIFVAGDLNGNAGRQGTEVEFQELYERTDLEDLFELHGALPEDRITFHHMRAGKRNDQQLDYVFLSQRLQHRVQKLPFIYEYLHPKKGRKRQPPTSMAQKQAFPSDHYPYVFEISGLSLIQDSNS